MYSVFSLLPGLELAMMHQLVLESSPETFHRRVTRAVPQAEYQPSPSGAQGHPYLLRNLEITRSNHVWAADITYIPMKRGFVYLFAVLDWASRRALSWRLSNTLTTDFCIEAVQEAINRYGAAEIFNTD